MKFTNEGMVQAIDILSTLSETGVLGYAIARNLRKLREEAKDYIAIRSAAVQKYGVQVDDGKAYEIKGSENVKNFREELGDLPNVEVDVDIFQIDVNTFTSGNITSDKMGALFWMVKEE